MRWRGQTQTRLSSLALGTGWKGRRGALVQQCHTGNLVAGRLIAVDVAGSAAAFACFGQRRDTAGSVSHSADTSTQQSACKCRCKQAKRVAAHHLRALALLAERLRLEGLQMPRRRSPRQR